MAARALDLFLYCFSYICKEKAMEGFISGPGHPRLTGGDKENILPNNMGKLYDFFLLLSMIIANMKKKVCSHGQSSEGNINK